MIVQFPTSHPMCASVWRCCSDRTLQCNNVPVTRTKTSRRCQAGWQPPSCTTGRST